MSDTETVSARYRGLDRWSDGDILAALWEAQADAVAAVRAALPATAAAASATAARLQRGGRLVYAGAGTSARLAAQDAAELGPTFDFAESRLVVTVAGGEAALARAVEDAEDDAAAGIAAMATHEVSAADTVLGVAASGATPFTLAALREARRRGALTIAVVNCHGSTMAEAAEHALVAATGPEVVAGSTRLKAGTAQKAMLNLFSTLLMTRLGHVHDGRMVDMRISNAKLRDRARRMVADLAGCDDERAADALRRAGRIKPAVLVACGLAPEAAVALLAQGGGHLRPALESIGR